MGELVLLEVGNDPNLAWHNGQQILSGLDICAIIDRAMRHETGQWSRYARV